MKEGDLVKYSDPDVECDLGLIVEICSHPTRRVVKVLWPDGDIWSDDSYAFEVINEGRLTCSR